jgi:orotate phosphoribosyltransferase-like protein
MTEAVALACVGKESRPKRVTNKWDADLYAKVLAQRRQGLTFKEIGRELGISAVQARNQVIRASLIPFEKSVRDAMDVRDAMEAAQ